MFLTIYVEIFWFYRIIRTHRANVYNHEINERILKSKADFIPLEDDQQTSDGDNDMPLHKNIPGEE
ncbi:MAG: hypothetical protein ABI760_00805 [Ferruginibacter sp.]